MKKLLLLLIPAVILSCDQENGSQQQQEDIQDTTTINQDVQSIVEWNHTINWFEIAATDLERAKTFYETILNIKMQILTDTAMGGYSMAFFAYPGNTTIVSGALVQSKDFIPCDHGTLVYLNANPDLSVVLDRIEDAGGKITMPKTLIAPEIGYMAVFIDSEENKVALHSLK